MQAPRIDSPRKPIAKTLAAFAAAAGIAGIAVAPAAQALDTPARPPQTLAARALAADANAAAAAIAALRRDGPAAVGALLAAQDRAPVPEARFRQRLDLVCAQYDCAASHLFWYTDMEQARQEAARTGRPILALRLLGRLDEELSCANSRFFRTVLYANTEVARLLRDGFVLYWSSERPVPKVTIDFGDGRALVGTLTGNSIHYILDARGRLVDALPGLYGPRAFQSRLTAARDQAARLAPLADPEAAALLARYHREQRQIIDLAFNRDRRVLNPSPRPAASTAPRPAASAATNEIAAADAAPTAYQAAPLAASKMASEWRPLRALSLDGSAPPPSPEDWLKIAQLHPADWQLDPQARADLERRQAARAADPAASRAAVDRFERLVGADTLRNEYLLHRTLHTWLAADSARLPDLAAFNERVYADLFLTPRTDPWLGLAAPETFLSLTPVPAAR